MTSAALKSVRDLKTSPFYLWCSPAVCVAVRPPRRPRVVGFDGGLQAASDGGRFVAGGQRRTENGASVLLGLPLFRGPPPAVRASPGRRDRCSGLATSQGVAPTWPFGLRRSQSSARMGSAVEPFLVAGDRRVALARRRPPSLT